MIIYTKHAIKRMIERGISKRDVEKSIKNPDNARKKDNQLIINKRINRKTLEIILAKENNKIVVITCYHFKK